MSRRRCYFGCKGKLNVFACPKEERTRQHWIRFMFPGQQQPYHAVFLCSRHFTKESFCNISQYEAGFSDRLRLKDGAVPSVKGRVEESETPTAHVLTPYRHTGCQTVPESTVSVAMQFKPQMVSAGTQLSCSASTKSAGTQLSYGGLKQRVRSKGFRPAKRPHLELLEVEEEEEDDEENISEIPQPHDSTYDPGGHTWSDSGKESSQSTIDYEDPKYIVFESCLRDLFQTCPVCKRDCDVHQRRLGTFVSFSQLCPNCQYTRKWQSQPNRGSRSTPVEMSIIDVLVQNEEKEVTLLQQQPDPEPSQGAALLPLSAETSMDEQGSEGPEPSAECQPLSSDFSEAESEDDVPGQNEEKEVTLLQQQPDPEPSQEATLLPLSAETSMDVQGSEGPEPSAECQPLSSDFSETESEDGEKDRNRIT